jgi:uncharacterized protein (TIRG00374 family)
MRKWLFWLLFLTFIWLILSHLAEIQTLALTLSRGELTWILAAGGMMIPYYLVYAVSYQVAYDAVGIKRSIRELLPVIFGMLFVNLVTPTGGSAGVALFVDDAARRGYSAARTMSGTILQLLADFGSLSMLMIASLVYLSSRGSLFAYHIAGASIQLALTIILSASLMLGLWSPALLLRLLRGLQRLANGLARLARQPNFLEGGWTEEYAAELTEASRSIARRPSRLALAFLAMLVADLLAMAALSLLFLAFRVPASLGAVAVGYVVGILFWMVPLTPQGVGIVESAMTLTFISFDVPAIPAAAITLSFRGLIFWLPTFLGFILLRKVKTFEDVTRRTPPGPVEASDADRHRARLIIHAHGRTSQAHLALLNDKLYYFSPGGSLVPYTVSGRTAVSLGDPIGPARDAESAIRGFLDFCRQNNWMVVFAMTESDYLDVYRRAGYVHMCLGHEGVVDLTTFTLKGNIHSNFRKRFHRLTREGYRVEICEPPLSDSVLRELRQISDEWLAMTRAEEKRFFLACFEDDYVRQERVALVYTPEGGISAFANLAPEYQRKGLSIDLMRHRQKFESGTMDFLFVSLLFWAREHGYESFNLGLSPLFGVGTRPDASLMDRILNLIYEHTNFYNFKGLNGFKAKFRPYWTPLYMVFPGWGNLLRCGLALAKANSGAGETLWSYFKRRPRRKGLDEPSFPAKNFPAELT